MPERTENGDKDYRPELRGAQVELYVDDGEGKASSPLRYVFGEAEPEAEQGIESLYEGFTIKSGEIQTASGHCFYALLELDALSSYEHYATGIAVMSRSGPCVIWHDDSEDYQIWLAAMREAEPDFELCPYQYRYFDIWVAEDDHHVGVDGWSPHYRRP